MTPKDPDINTGEDDIPGPASTSVRSPRSLPGGIGIPVNTGAAPDPAAAVPRDEMNLEAISGRVSALLDGGRLREAENLLSRGLEIYPENVDLLKELGVLYHLQGRYGKAARTFTRVMNITGEERHSSSWRIASLSQKAYDELRGPDPGASLPTFDQILALDPSDREALAGKIAAFRVLGRMDEAQGCLREGLSLEPPGPSILYQEGWLYMDHDRPDLAREAFGQSSLADPAWPEPVLSGALALERLGKGTEGVEILRAFAESRQEIPGLRAEIGWFLLTLHDLGMARGIFSELADREGDPGGFHGLAALFLAMGRTGDAKAIMGRLADAYPRDPLIQVNYGMVLARAGGARDLALAAISARRALALHPGLAPAHACLGVVASKQGRVDEAEAHFTEAIRLSDPSGYRNLGLLTCAGGRWEEAEPLLERATLADPLDARAWAGLGAIELRRGRFDEALPHLRRAGMLDPRDTSIARGLTLALEGSGDPAGAEEAIRRALALAPPPGTWVLLLELAALLIHRGEPPGNPLLDEEAAQLLQKAEGQQPDDPGILFYEGVAESRLGNPKRGLELFSSSMRGSGYRIPARENIRRLRKHLGARRGITGGILTARMALALFSLSQLAATWYLFTARLVSETAFGLLIAMFSGLFALSGLLPARNGGVRTESLPELVLPERTFVPSPEADMVSPLIRLRTALRPRTGLSPRP